VELPRFLAEHPPFAALEPEALEGLASGAEVEFVPAGTSVTAADRARFAYVIRTGAVEVLDDGRAVDLLGPGDVFGVLGHGRGSDEAVEIRAEEDSLLYVLDAEALTRAFGGRPHATRVGAFVLSGAGARWAGASAVGSLVRRPPVTAEPTETVAGVADRMTRERVSSVLVRDDDRWGIVTDRDLRTRVLAAGRQGSTPLGDILTAPLVLVPADTPAEEALLVMLEHGFHHAPIVAADGTVIGMVTDTDLLALERASPFALKSEIERGGDADEAVASARRLPDVVSALVDAGMDAVAIGRVVSVTIDALTRRLLDVAIAEHGEPEVPWAWLAFGSQARREQALRTDQDHGLVYDADADVDPAVDAHAERIAVAVTDGLERAGIARCEGHVMAENPAMRRTIVGWRSSFAEWMRAPDRQGSVYTSIVFDYRRVAGRFDPVPALDEVVAAARSVPGFVRHLAHRAVDDRPPTGFRNHLVVEAKGEHAGRLDVKHRGVTLVSNLARLHAVRAASVEKGTLARLRAAASAGVLDDESAEALDEAFRLLWSVRLEHQRACVRQGVDPDDFVDPATLGPVKRRALREAFAVVTGAQRTVALELDIR
jgi:CBS domain-containing protein